MGRVRMKICCIRDAREARLAIDAGADALGLVGPMPNGPGQIDAEQVRRITAMIPAAVSSWLLTTATDADAIIAAADRSAAQVIQLVKSVTPATCDAVRARRPALRLVSVIHVQDARAIAEAERIAPHVHGVLLDSGKPDAAEPTYGGTGDTHDWRISRQVVAAVQTPVWLAGGLTAENVADAVRAVGPFGVDVCSRLRVDGRLDAKRVIAFAAALRSV